MNLPNLPLGRAPLVRKRKVDLTGARGEADQLLGAELLCQVMHFAEVTRTTRCKP